MLHRAGHVVLSLVGLVALSVGCSNAEQPAASALAADSTGTTIQSLLPAERMAKVKASLPKVGFDKINDILNSSETLWYDHESMTPSYQDSVGVNSNADWSSGVAKTPQTNSAITGLFDANNKRWTFPFSVTAGTDKSTNTKVVNFLHLPHEGGKPVPIPVWTQKKNVGRPSWQWIYPIGTIVGEVIFLADGSELVAVEVRTRQRYKDGWATNVFRPFPTAASLSQAIKAKNPNFASDDKLAGMVDHLGTVDGLKDVTLSGQGPLAKVFNQKAATDQLPPFQDKAFVKGLLKSKTFVSSYEQAWKADGAVKAFAPTTTEDLSIVPKNYAAHAIAVNDQSCARCHESAGRRVSEFYDALLLYGEVWGKDGVFSFHPFDESEFPKLRQNGNGPDGYYDNRKFNQKLLQMGVFEAYDAQKHENAKYPSRSQVLN